MNNAAIVDFSHLSALPAGNDDPALALREEALGNAMLLVVDEAKKYGFDYCDVILGLGKYAHINGMTTIELLLEGAYSEASTYGEHRTTKEAFKEVFLRVYGQICVNGGDYSLLSIIQQLKGDLPTAK